ncbi:MAG: rhomboid family intramembrane serine protease [Nevskia sp.]|nr:rhomboid family intramembrane serine protease [Nevskia sp.]
MTPLTYALLAANLAMFVLETQLGNTFLTPLVLWPLGAGFHLWQPLTSAFLHGNVAHLATNMFALWMFGRPVERALGSGRFLALYSASLATAAATQLLVTSLLPDKVPTLGASGAVFGVLAAFAVLYPNRKVMLLFPPIPMPARVFVFLYALLELFAGVTGTMPGIAHFAHLGGLVGGVALLRYWRRRDQDRAALPRDGGWR